MNLSNEKAAAVTHVGSLRVSRSQLKGSLLFPAFICLGGCSTSGAPSFDLFGAFFPAWLLCGVIGLAAAGAARVVFVSSGLANVLPYQLAVCTALGVTLALLIWLFGFGH
jgi:YtcA family